MNNLKLKSATIGLAVALLTARSGHAQTAVGLTSMLDTIYKTTDVFWLGTDQHVHLDYFNGSWNTSDVTADAGAPPAAAGSALTSVLDTIYRTPDVFYVGTDQHVHILYFNGSWHTTDLTAAIVRPQIAVGITQTGIEPAI